MPKTHPTASRLTRRNNHRLGIIRSPEYSRLCRIRHRREIVTGLLSSLPPGTVHPCPVGEEPGMLAGDALPAGLGFLDGAQSFVFVADPAHHVGVDARQEWIQRGAVERSVVLHPAPHNRVDLSCDLGEGEPDPAVQPPSADLTADLVLGVLADGWLKRDEHRSVLR